MIGNRHDIVDDIEIDDDDFLPHSRPNSFDRDPWTLPHTDPFFTTSKETDVIAIMTGSCNPVHPSHFEMAKHVYDTLTKDPNGFTVNNRVDIRFHLKGVVMSASPNRWAHDISKQHIKYIQLSQKDRNTLIEEGCKLIPGVKNTRIEEDDENIDWNETVVLYYNELKKKGFKGKIAYICGEDHAKHVTCISLTPQSLSMSINPNKSKYQKYGLTSNIDFMYFIMKRPTDGSGSKFDGATNFQSCMYKVFESSVSVGDNSSTKIRELLTKWIDSPNAYLLNIDTLKEIYKHYPTVLTTLYSMIAKDRKGNMTQSAITRLQQLSTSQTLINPALIVSVISSRPSTSSMSTASSSFATYSQLGSPEMLQQKQTNHWYTSILSAIPDTTIILFWSSTFGMVKDIEPRLQIIKQYIQENSDTIVVCSPSTYIMMINAKQESDSAIKQTKKQRIENLNTAIQNTQFPYKNRLYFLNDYVEGVQEYQLNFWNTIDCYRGKENSLIDFHESFHIFREKIKSLRKFTNVTQNNIKLLHFYHEINNKIYEHMTDNPTTYNKSTLLMTSQTNPPPEIKTASFVWKVYPDPS